MWYDYDEDKTKEKIMALFNIIIVVVGIIATVLVTGGSFKDLLVLPVILIYFIWSIGTPIFAIILIIYMMATTFKK